MPAIMLCVGDVEVSPLLVGPKSPVGMTVSTYVSGSASHASYTATVTLQPLVVDVITIILL